MSQHRQDALPAGSILHQVYRIERVLGSGAFGITYLAQHIHLNSLWVIKEYLPESAVRHSDQTTVSAKNSNDPLFAEGLKSFFQEAQILHNIRHRNIVEVKDLFAENGTAYFVMPYMGSQTLLDRIAARPQPEYEDLQRIFMPLLEGLKEIHRQNLLHRDIKPANILLPDNKEPVLIDFGSARFTIGKSQPVTTILTPGFAPIEQYSMKGSFSPALDLYSLSACLYQAITGELPAEASDRLDPKKGDPQPRLANDSRYTRRYPQHFLAAVDKGLSIHAHDRFQSAFEMQAALNGSSPAAPSAQAAAPAAPKTQIVPPPQKPAKQQTFRQPEKTATPAPQQNRSGCFGWLFKLAVLGALAGGGYAWFSQQQNGKGSRTAADNSERPYHGTLNITLPSGKTATYTGRIENGQANDSSGKAVMNISDGAECTGSFRNNRREGEVLCTYPKGSTYNGMWKNDKKHGYGRYSYTVKGAQYIYEGGFVNDKLNGKGKLTYPGGAVFEGEFANDDIKNKGKGSMTGMDLKAFLADRDLPFENTAARCEGTFGRTTADCSYRDGSTVIRYRGKHKNGLWQDDDATLTVHDNDMELMHYQGGFNKGKPSQFDAAAAALGDMAKKAANAALTALAEEASEAVSEAAQ